MPTRSEEFVKSHARHDVFLPLHIDVEVRRAATLAGCSLSDMISALVERGLKKGKANARSSSRRPAGR